MDNFASVDTTTTVNALQMNNGDNSGGVAENGGNIINGKGGEIGGISTILQFDPFNYQEEEEEWTCSCNRSVRCWIGMEILYFIENIMLLFVVYALITYISSLVACKLCE